MDDPRKHAYVLAEIKGIPMQLWDILCPRTFKDFALYLKNIEKWREGRNDRIKAFSIWQQYKGQLPLEARKWSLRRIHIALRIIELKKRQGFKDQS
ncbi:hypothetical protein LCGC14_1355010 [marine sediment metagenome]|uniref:Uncharacterized protein n=1 Tax=marine sediment metagenome TaxID=412755 RepID=A0A0F9NC32_9ZZZZ